MKKNESIRNILTSSVKTASTKNKISEVKNMMQDNNIHHVPVVSGKKLIGMISRTDILRTSYSDLFVSQDPASDAQLDSVAKVEDIMTRDIKTLTVNDSIREAAQILLSAHFNSIPVIDENEDLAGIVTSKDMIRYLVENY